MQTWFEQQQIKQTRTNTDILIKFDGKQNINRNKNAFRSN